MPVSKMLLRFEMDRALRYAEAMLLDVQQSKGAEAFALAEEISRKIRQIQNLQITLAFAEGDPRTQELAALYQAFRQLKLELRFYRRRWKRMLTTEARFRKLQEKEEHVASFAA